MTSILKRGAGAGLAVAGLMTLVACAPGADAPSTSQSPAASATGTGVSKDFGTEPITLNVSTWNEPGVPIKEIATEFMADYPNVTVEVQTSAFPDYAAALQLNLASDSAPCIAGYTVATAASNGLVISLNEYSDLYGWDTQVPSSVRDQWSVTEDYKTLGGDNMVALPTNLSIVGLFMNKELAAKAGIAEAPKTLEELEAAFGKAAAAGLLPLQMGNAQGHASFMVQSIGQSLDGAPSAGAWALGKSGSTFDTEGNRTGAQKLVDWLAAGYIPESVNGSDLQTAVTNFTQGKGVFLQDGNWDAGKIDEAMGDNVTFVPFPGAQPTAIGGGDAYAISSKCKTPDAAAAFLNYVISADAAAKMFASGYLPIAIAGAVPTTALQEDLVSAFGAISAANGIVGFNNNVTKSMNDTLTSTTQQLLAGKASVDEFVTAVQTDWAGSHS